MTNKDSIYTYERLIEQFIEYYQDNNLDVINLRIVRTFCEEIIDSVNKLLEESKNDK